MRFRCVQKSLTSNNGLTTARLQVTLADQQADPNSPLFSAKSFEDLNL
jgi:hypothetical protein